MTMQTFTDPQSAERRAEGLGRLTREFEHPSAEFSPMPFWFWNDTLTEAEIARQMRAFKEKDVDGFVIHPRLGLDPEIPYMGEKWLHFVRYAVSLAKELDMTAQQLNRLLCEMRIQYWQSGQYMLYADYARQGFAKSRTRKHVLKHGMVITEMYLVWTESGREFIHRLLNPKLAN